MTDFELELEEQARRWDDEQEDLYWLADCGWQLDGAAF